MRSDPHPYLDCRIFNTTLLVGVTYQRVGEGRDAMLHPPPGKFVSLGTHRLHLLEEGRGSPTIILEAGLMSTNLSWTDIRRKLAESYRVVTYDRAGLGWSDLGPMPRTAERIVDELHSLLERAAISGPYVLVGHSFGGLTMPLFAARHPEKIAGMVLVDPVVPAEWNPPSEQDLKRASIGATVCRRAALLSRAGVIRFVAFLLNSRAKKVASHMVRLISRGTPADSGSVPVPGFGICHPMKGRWRQPFGFKRNSVTPLRASLRIFRDPQGASRSWTICALSP
jgi:pimeloyl-ACP methyl ester carboxylesterase